jgi:thioredoxin 1
MPNLIDITQKNFQETTLDAPVPVLVEFSAAWCAPCRTIAPHLRAIATEQAARLRVGICDVDEHPELAARFDVRGMPTLLLFKGGQVIGQMIGAAPRARIEAFVARAFAP